MGLPADAEPSAARALDGAPAPVDILRDPLLLSPAERIQDLVSAVERDDLLAVVLVLQNAPAAEVLAQPERGGGHALDIAVRAPIRNPGARKLITECLLFSTLPDFDVEAYFASLPADAQSTSIGSILYEWNKGARDEAGDAYSLCEDLTMGQVEEWIATHLESQPANGVGETEPGSVAEGISNSNEPSTGSPTLSASDMVKREASLSASPSVADAVDAEESKPVLASKKSTATNAPSTSYSAAVELTALGRLVVRNLPLTVTVLQLKDLVGPAMLGYTLAVSIPQDQATATVDVATIQAAHEAAARLYGHEIEEGGQRRILETEVVLSIPPPPPSVTKHVAPPAAPASLPSSPPEARFREFSRSRVAPRASVGGGEREHDFPRRESLPKRPRSGSPASSREWDPSRYRRTPSPRRYDSRSPVRTSTSPYRTRPVGPEPQPFWYYAIHIPASISERRLTDDLLDVDITVHDIVVEHSKHRNDLKPSRTAAIAFKSRADAKKAEYHFTCRPYEGRTLVLKEYRDPRSGAKVPRRDGRIPYVNHRHNLAHPPLFPYARVTIRGWNPSRSEEHDLRTLLIGKISGRDIESLHIELKPASCSPVAHLHVRNRAAAVDLIEGFDGYVADGYALSVNWDDPNWRVPPPPPRRWRQYGQ